MPRNKKNNKPGNSSTTDVTLADFADNTLSNRVRLSKKKSISLNRAAKDGIFEENFDNLDQEEPENISEACIAQHHPMLKISKSTSNIETGKDYPLDIYYLLGDYIKPEDIQVFAALCQKSLHVVQSYKFWLSLYRRYYKPNASLPDFLQPIRIERPLFIKASVIRALFHLYPPMAKRNKTIDTSKAVGTLLQKFCLNIWHQTQEGRWIFYLKFARSVDNEISRDTRKMPESWESENETENINWTKDIISNPDDGCCVLSITSTQFLLLPAFMMGQRLSDFKLGISSDLQGQKLTMTFSPYLCKGLRRNKINSQTVEMDRVQNLQVLPWWHPQYIKT